MVPIARSDTGAFFKHALGRRKAGNADEWLVGMKNEVINHMCEFREIDLEHIHLHDRPGGWLSGELPFDVESCICGEKDLEAFLKENPVIMLEMATNLFYSRELGISMTRMFYFYEKEKQTPCFLSFMNTVFERMSAWYEEDDDGREYLLVQGEGISDAGVQLFERLEEKGELEPFLSRLYVNAHFWNDLKESGYYHLEAEPSCEGDESDASEKLWIRSLFQQPDFRNYGSINVSGLRMQQLKQDPVLRELLALTDEVYLYVFDICLKQSGEKKKKYVKILRWNIKDA